MTFDPQCRTEQNYDYLQIYEDPDKQHPILEKYTGRDGTENWPTEPIVVKGRNTLYFHFYSDGSNNDWGFKCTVSGIIPETTEDETILSKDDVNIEDLTVRSFVKTVTLLINSMSRHDETLRDGVLDIFADLLQKAKPGSMSHLSELVDASVSEFSGFLQNLLSDASEEQRSKIIVLLVALSIARGSQLDLLKLLP